MTLFFLMMMILWMTILTAVTGNVQQQNHLWNQTGTGREILKRMQTVPCNALQARPITSGYV